MSDTNGEVPVQRLGLTPTNSSDGSKYLKPRIRNGTFKREFVYNVENDQLMVQKQIKNQKGTSKERSYHLLTGRKSEAKADCTENQKAIKIKRKVTQISLFCNLDAESKEEMIKLEQDTHENNGSDRYVLLAQLRLDRVGRYDRLLKRWGFIPKLRIQHMAQPVQSS